MPESSLISVDLPAPFSPQSAWISPGSRLKKTSCSAVTPPKRFVISQATKIGSDMAGLRILPTNQTDQTNRKAAGGLLHLLRFGGLVRSTGASASGTGTWPTSE